MATKVKKKSTKTSTSSVVLPGDAGGTHYKVAPDTEEVRQWSETESKTEITLAKSLQLAQGLRERWQERVAKEGKMYFVNPFDKGSSRKLFETKKACQDHMNKHCKMQIEQAKLTKQPKHIYTPQPYIKAPKITLEDVMDPRVAKLTRQAKASQAAKTNVAQPLGKVRRPGIISDVGIIKTTAGQIVTLMEHVALQKLKSLDDLELQKLVGLAEAYGKRPLVRAALAEQRGRKEK